MRISDWSSDVCSSDLQGKSIREYTQQYEDAFLQDSAALRLERPERIVRATEHIDDMVKAVEQLAANGHTYQSDGSTYFRIATFPEYGRLSRLPAVGMQSGARHRVDKAESEKDDARDCVLWKERKSAAE